VDAYLALALIGLGAGAVIASLSLGIVVAYKGTGVINFAQGAIAMWGAYVYHSLTSGGRLVMPWLLLPNSFDVGGPVGRWPAFGLGVASAVLVSLLAEQLVLKRMRRSPALGQAVATIGIMLTIQGLTTLQFGTGTIENVRAILPVDLLKIGSVSVTEDRLLVAGLVVIATAAVWAWFRYSRTGLACRAASESAKGATLTGLSPDLLATVTWAVSGALAGVFGILVAPLISLSTDIYPLLVVPALAAALVGRLRGVGSATVAALLIGCAQASIQYFVGQGWVPGWAQAGLPEALPLVVVIVALVLLGRSLPGRSPSGDGRLPPVRIPRANRYLALLVPVGIAGMVLLPVQYRLALIVSVAAMGITMSQVVLTGFVGQISFFQAEMAGVGAFTLSKLTTSAHLPFPVGPLVALMITTGFGVVIGLPALRIRGTQLSIVTLAAAAAIDAALFQNTFLLGANGLAPVAPPRLFGVDLGPSGGSYPRVVFGIVVLLVVSALYAGVAWVLRGPLGRAFLAVRSDEHYAASTGINPIAAKVAGFALASLCAGVSGVLLGELRGEISAEDFLVFVSLSYLAVTYIGGIGSLGGAVLAGLAVNSGLSTTLLDHAVNWGKYYLLGTGLVLVVSAVTNPEGIVIRTEETLARLRRLRARRRGTEEVAVQTPEPLPVARESAVARPEGSSE